MGGLPVVARTHRGLVRLESSIEGTLAGPQVVADLDPAVRAAACTALAAALAERVRGRTIVAAMTVAPDEGAWPADVVLNGSWRHDDYETAIVDCRGGLDQVERDLWTNNRRNERNRGLKRGCTLQAEHGSDALANWYPLYDAESRHWAQAPVPRSLLQDLLESLPDQCVLNTVRLDGEIIAGHLCFRSRDHLVAWQGAARSDLQRSHFPTTLVYWQDIRHACDEGLSGVDFGGCVGRVGLWDFKRRCGAVPESRRQYLTRSSLGRLLEWARRRWRGGAK